ncbi:unannotated protein [freshwater metagenome]|uniref:Unannotated protein n=1 Tax=freshwater metagenome TaxID=449393 RepID=A0A6J6RVD3_9ZZZZ
MGTPKALVDDWLRRSVGVLLDGGCDGVVVVLGAGAPEATPLVDGLAVDVVVADDWADGMAASLRAGLRSLDPTATAAVVHLVDLPDVTAPVVARLLARTRGAHSLARATYAGRPGHPVLLGRDHWEPVVATARGDHGARDYLAAHEVEAVECGDLATGHDQDLPRDGG